MNNIDRLGAKIARLQNVIDNERRAVHQRLPGEFYVGDLIKFKDSSIGDQYLREVVRNPLVVSWIDEHGEQRQTEAKIRYNLFKHDGTLYLSNVEAYAENFCLDTENILPKKN